MATASAAVLLAAPSVTASRSMADGPYELAAPAFDISAAPDGSILVANGESLTTIRRGEVETINSIPLATSPVSGANGVAAIGAKSAYVATGGADEAIDAGIWRVNSGQVKLVGDISAFERANDPDTVWKHPECEEDSAGGFSAGPQSNPYHLTIADEGVLAADAAGNTVYAVGDSGLELAAVLTPPVVDGKYMFLKNDEIDGTLECFVQPVPTSVAVGADGSYYVGELTGALAIADGLPIGLSRVWKLAPGSRDVVCSELDPDPDPACQVLIDGLTSVIDIEIGPDGKLYVVEYDANSWLASFIPGLAAGGSVKACDTDTGACTVVHDDLEFPSAITFDKWGDLWLLEKNFFAPTVRRL
jgi:hypothetical protein